MKNNDSVLVAIQIVVGLAALWICGSYLVSDHEARQRQAIESIAKAQWQQVYWLKRQALALEAPCYTCE